MARADAWLDRHPMLRDLVTVLIVCALMLWGLQCLLEIG